MSRINPVEMDLRGWLHKVWKGRRSRGWWCVFRVGVSLWTSGIVLELDYGDGGVTGNILNIPLLSCSFWGDLWHELDLSNVILKRIWVWLTKMPCLWKLNKRAPGIPWVLWEHVQVWGRCPLWGHQWQQREASETKSESLWRGLKMRASDV